MRKNIITAIIVGFMVVMSAGMVYADASVGVDVNSAYVWRGATFNDGFVIQPNVDVSKGGFGVNVWGNFDIDDYNGALDEYEFSEIDLTLSYGFDMGPIGTTVGMIVYMFPCTEEQSDALTTEELFISLGTDLFAGISGGLDIYYDADEAAGDIYGNLSLGYSASLGEKASLDLGAAMGYIMYNDDAGDDGLFDYLLSAGLGYSLTDDLSIGVSLNYADSFDEDRLETDTNLFGGVSVSYGL